MKKRILSAMLMLLTLAGGIAAQEEHLVMQFDFSNVSGKSVTDSVSGVTAKLMGVAKVVSMGDRNVLNLGNGSGYLDLSKNAGNVVKGLGNFTVSAYYKLV